MATILAGGDDGADVVLVGGPVRATIQERRLEKSDQAETPLSPAKMFERGVVTPERYLCWHKLKTRELVRRVMMQHPDLRGPKRWIIYGGSAVCDRTSNTPIRGLTAATQQADATKLNEGGCECRQRCRRGMSRKGLIRTYRGFSDRWE
jgi:hypothetical protein